MSSIQEILKLQAAAVKQKQDKIAQAEQLEAAAKILRQQAAASNPSKFDNTIRAVSREERLDKFGSIIGRFKAEKINKAVAIAGWRIMPAAGSDGKRVFGKRGRPGLQLKIAGGRFSVVHGDHVIQQETSIDNLNTFLAKKI